MVDQNLEELESQQADEFDFSEYEQESPSEKITIDGVEYDPDTLKSELSKAKDYTRKTQELAEQRREMEAVVAKAQQLDGLAEAFERNPQEVIRVLSEQSGGYKPSSDFGNPEDYTENERKLMEHIKLQDSKLTEALGTLKQSQWMAQEYAADRKAMAAVDDIESKYGAKVSPLELRKLMDKHGIGNPEAAWVYENRDSLRQAPPSRPKPNVSAPTSKSKVIPFDKWKDWGVEQIEASRHKGFVLEDKPKKK